MKKSFLRDVIEFVGVYVLSMFLAIFVIGKSPEDLPRFFLASLLITLAIFGGYESGKNSAK